MSHFWVNYPFKMHFGKSVTSVQPRCIVALHGFNVHFNCVSCDHLCTDILFLHSILHHGSAKCVWTLLNYQTMCVYVHFVYPLSQCQWTVALCWCLRLWIFQMTAPHLRTPASWKWVSVCGHGHGGAAREGRGRVRQPPFFHTTPWGNGGSLRKTLFQRGEIELLLLPEHVQHLYLQVGKSWVFKPLTRTITPVWFEEVLNWQNTLTYLRIRISDISQYGMHVCILNNSSIVAVVCHVVIHFTITVTLWWSNLCWELS